jgi:hypothetical protein
MLDEEEYKEVLQAVIEYSSVSQVRNIKKQLAIKYGVSTQYIHDVCKRKLGKMPLLNQADLTVIDLYFRTVKHRVRK